MGLIKILLFVAMVISSLAIVGLVLVQHGKGADAGAGFGGGSSSASLFGASGASNFLSRMTSIAAVVFFSSVMGIVFLSSYKPSGLGAAEALVKKSAPAASKVSASAAKPAKAGGIGHE